MFERITPTRGKILPILVAGLSLVAFIGCSNDGREEGEPSRPDTTTLTTSTTLPATTTTAPTEGSGYDIKPSDINRVMRSVTLVEETSQYPYYRMTVVCIGATAILETERKSNFIDQNGYTINVTESHTQVPLSLEDSSFLCLSDGQMPSQEAINNRF